MDVERFNQWVRPVLLIALLGWFTTSLVMGLRADERTRGFGRSAEGLGADPGVRVLIQNRQPGDPHRSFERLVIQALVPIEVVATEDPLGKRERLKAGAKLAINPEMEGFSLDSEGWVSGGRVLRWNVTGVVLMPVDTRPLLEGPAIDKDGNPMVRNPRSFEEASGRPVCALLSTVGVGGKVLGAYRGSMYANRISPKEVALVNMLPVEAYLEGVLPYEMSPDYPLEALKAQAIASRGYAFARSQDPSAASRAFDLFDGTDDQEYRGAGAATAAISRAVAETRGVLMTLHDAPFLPFFHGASGGHTASISQVFSGARDAFGRESLAPVFIAAPDPACLSAVAALGKQATHGQTVYDIPLRQIQKRLADAYAPSGVQIGYINQIRVGARDPRSGRVETVLVHHTLGGNLPLAIPGHRFRMIVDPTHIRSTLWPADPKKIESPDGRVFSYRFTCLGWGHGVGMSQLSAWQMARNGSGARSILDTFYAGIELRTRW